MPRYFFHTRIDRVVIKDEGGTVLPGHDQAREVARGTAQEMMQDPINRTHLLTATLVVTNEAGEVVLEFPFADALAPPRNAGTVH